jgi:hypothetical protein
MIEITLETLTIASFALIFVRMNSKKQIRNSVAPPRPWKPTEADDGEEPITPRLAPQRIHTRESGESDFKEDLTKDGMVASG